ncbi:MAG: dihydrodipicolinate synthase family protein [Steroidobacterales bacterium]
MDGKRREAIALMGAAAAAAMIGRAAPSGAASAATAARNLGSASKTLYWIAAATPCDKNLKFDPGAFRDMLAYFKHNGADGIVVLGTTGEFPSFSVAERKQVAEVALKDKLGMNIIVGPGTSNIAETIELAKHAEANGADGLLVIPPFYYKKPPTDGLTRYYSMLFDQVSIAISLYHIPGTSGVPISHELLRNLMHYPNLAGIKDSNGPADEYAEFVKAFPELNMRTGTENNIPYALDNGMGAICMDGNVFTKALADVFTAFRAGKDYHAAFAAYNARVKIMKDLQTGVWNYGPLKYALSVQMGGPQTYQRPPYSDVTEAQKAAIRKALDQIKGMG